MERQTQQQAPEGDNALGDFKAQCRLYSMQDPLDPNAKKLDDYRMSWETNGTGV